MRYEDLNEEQKQLLRQYEDKWIKICIDTTPTDRAEVERRVDAVYASLGKPPPRKVWFRGPWEAYHKCKGTELAFEFSDCLYGQHDASWLCCNEFALEVLNDQRVANLRPVMELSKVSGWWCPKDDVCILMDKHTVVKSENGQFHCTTGPVYQHADAGEYSQPVYALEGIIIPKDVFDLIFVNPDPAKILAIKNTEHRVLAMKYARSNGVEVLDLLPNEVLEVSESKAWDLPNEPEYTLLKVQITEGIESICLKMRNPSEPKWYYEFVPDDRTTLESAIKFRKEKAYAIINQVLGTNLEPKNYNDQFFRV